MYPSGYGSTLSSVYSCIMFSVLSLKERVYDEAFECLIFGNCFRLGQNPRFTNKRLTKYLYCCRRDIAVFKTGELNYMILRIYPFIKTLFTNHRANLHSPRRLGSKIPNLGGYNLEKSRENDQARSIVEKYSWPYHRRLDSLAARVSPWRVLFVTSDINYACVVESAAILCQMFTYSQE
jgi:hypothetical protein